MAAARKKGEPKTPKNFRLTEDAIKAIEDLSLFFDESQADTVERAITYLSENKELASKREHDKRVNKI